MFTGSSSCVLSFLVYADCLKYKGVICLNHFGLKLLFVSLELSVGWTSNFSLP